jgi:hypothetical protein
MKARGKAREGVHILRAEGMTVSALVHDFLIKNKVSN